MYQKMVPEIDNLIQKLTELRMEFENRIESGRSYEEAKIIYLQMKELSQSLRQLQANEGGEAAAN